jgi:hypothetical protein
MRKTTPCRVTGAKRMILRMQSAYSAAGNFAHFCYLTIMSPLGAKHREALAGFIRWHVSRMMREQAAWNRPERFTVILQSYNRPWNMQRIVDTVLRCGFVGKIIVSNNNPSVRIRSYITTHDERVTLIDQTERQWAIARFHIAANEPAEYFVALDDDIFLRPAQLTALATALLLDTSVPHGMFATLVSSDGIDHEIIRKGQYGFTGAVDIVQRAYFFTKQHVRVFHEILKNIETESLARPTDANICDDIILSVSGSSKPMCHDVGAFADCFSSTMKGIALYRSVEGFHDIRMSLLRRLQEKRGLRSRIA